MSKFFKTLNIILLCALLILSVLPAPESAFAATSATYEGKTFSASHNQDYIDIYIDGVERTRTLVNTKQEVEVYDVYIMSIDNVAIKTVIDSYSVPQPVLVVTWTQYRNTGSIQKIYEANINNLVAGSVATPTFSRNGDLVSIVFPENAIHKKYRIASGAWQNYTTPLSTTNGIEAVGADKFGHVSSIGYFQNSTPPQIALSVNTTALARFVTITANITDKLGIVDKKYALGNYSVAYMSQNGIGTSISSFSTNFQVYENGTYTVYAKNNAGLMSVKTIQISNIDRDPPTKPVILISPAEPAYDYTVTINYSSDSTKKEFRIGSGTWQPYTKELHIDYNTIIYARAADQLGNESEVSQLVNNNIKHASEYNYDANGRLIKLGVCKIFCVNSQTLLQ